MSNNLNPAQLLIPAIRWNDNSEFSNEREKIDLALKLGVGGFIFFGGKAASVKELIAELRSRSKNPLIIGADLERGAGQQFDGLTQLPPLAAIGHLNDLDIVRHAAIVTANEAKALGVNWVYAPSCDLDIEPDNPIIGTRSFGADPRRVADMVSEWVDACQHAGVMACAKHFPGHGRTVRDSHAELPNVDVSARELYETDLLPFRAAIDAGVSGVMTAHVAFPALDPSGAPATLSRPILHDLLRTRLGFDGIVVTDAFIMEGVLDGGEKAAAVRAIEAGCDILLYPNDIEGVALALEKIDEARVRDALYKRNKWVEWCTVSPGSGNAIDILSHKTWAHEIAVQSVHALNDVQRSISNNAVDVITIDDDVGGPYPPPSREVFTAELRDNGMDVAELDIPSLKANRVAIVALYGDVRAWKGRAGYSDASIKAVQRACDAAHRAGQNVIVVLFSHPRMKKQLSNNILHNSPVLCAWGGEAIMQRAAARYLRHAT